MTFFRTIIASLALVVLCGDVADAGDADYRATLQRVAKMEPVERQRWLLELESRLDATTRKVLSREQAAKQRVVVYKLLRQKVVSRQGLVELLRLADQREQTLRAMAARPDPLEFLRQSIIRRDRESPLPAPTPSNGLAQRRGAASWLNGGAIPHPDPGEVSPPTFVPKLATDITARRFGDSSTALDTRVTPKPDRRTIDLPIEADRVAEESSKVVGSVPPRLTARTDTAKRTPGTDIEPRRPTHSLLDPGSPRTFAPPTVPESSPARLVQGGSPKATDPGAAGLSIRRTVLKPPIPPNNLQPPTDSAPVVSQPDLPPKVPSVSPKPPAIAVNVGELSARVAGTNFALRTLEAELDDRVDLTAEELVPLVDRLVKIVTRRNDLVLYMGVISSQQRSTAGRLQSPRTVILQLQSRIDSARTDAAGPQFSGSVGDRQAVLRGLDELSRRLGEL